MKRRDVKNLPGARRHASPGPLEGHYPQLGEFLTDACFEDGTRRESPTITFWAQGGLWKASVKDRAESLVMWLSAEKLLELMQLLELYVASEDAPWRVDDYKAPDNGRRTKR